MGSINYRDYKDLSVCIRKNLHKLPDFDLIVGIPRSGMVPAYMIGQFLNKKVCSIDEFLADIEPTSGYSREVDVSPIHSVLIVDDSIHSGVALGKTKKRISEARLHKKYSINYLAVYAREESKDFVDYHFEILPLPRLFQWNYMNHNINEKTCYDIDGVICVDPTSEQNDDGPKYLDFLLNAKPLYLPKKKVFALVTSRLEKYRPQTEEWMKKNGVEYEHLFMLDLPTKEDRIKANMHGKFKAEIYHKLEESVLFIESEVKQAKEIAYLSGKPCICIGNDEIFHGDGTIRIIENSVAFDSSKSKKVLLFTHEFSYTGAPHSLLRIARILKRNGYYVEVWGPKEGPFIAEFEKESITVEVVPYSKLSSNEIISSVKGFDLAIVNTAIPDKYFSFVSVYCPTIWYIREAGNLKEICRGNVDRELALKNAEKLYCVSEYAEKYISDDFNSNVLVVHNCVEDYYSPSNPQCKIGQNDEISMIVMGTISERKAFDVCIDAFDKLPSESKEKIHLYFAGRLSEYYVDYWTNILKRIEGNSKITYLGEIKDTAEKNKLLCSMDVVVVPSKDESCSLVALEGAMMAKPLIVSENVGARYIVSNDNGWVAKTGDSDDLCRIFEEVIVNRNSLSKMGEFSRKAYEKMSSMDVYERNILQMVEDNLVDSLLEYRASRGGIETKTKLTPLEKVAFLVKNLDIRGLLYAFTNYMRYDNPPEKSPVLVLGTKVSTKPFEFSEQAFKKKHIESCSILSLGYPPLNGSVSVRSSNKRRFHIYTDFYKTMFESMKKSHSDYIIVDLLDERFNLCRIELSNGDRVTVTKSILLMDSWPLIKIDDVETKDLKMHIVHPDSIRQDLLIEQFCKGLKKEWSEDKIIINESYMPRKYLDRNLNIVNFDDEKMDYINKVNAKLKSLYTFLKAGLPNSKVISMPEWVVAEPTSGTAHPLDFPEEYYKYVASEVDKFVIKKPKYRFGVVGFAWSKLKSLAMEIIR